MKLRNLQESNPRLHRHNLFSLIRHKISSFLPLLLLIITFGCRDISDTGKSVVFLSGPHVLASGFVVKNTPSVDYIITCYHVVQDANEEMYINNIPAKLAGIDPFDDLAIITIPHGKLNIHPLEFDKGGLGDNVVAIGCTPVASTMYAKLYQYGRVSCTAYTMISPLGDMYITANTGLKPGMSGGPLINEQGKVVGVSSAMATTHDVRDPSVCLFVDGKTTEHFLLLWFKINNIK